MALNSWARRFASAVALAIGPWAMAQDRLSFELTAPLIVTHEGVRADHPRADWLRWVNPPDRALQLDPDPVNEVYTFLDRPLSPVKAIVSPFAEGAQLYFREGFAFRLSSLGPPILTWSEGSVGDGVAAPASNFHLISFRDAQPPLMLTYPGKSIPLKVTGEPGNWVVRSGAPFEGWVRVLTPFGREARSGADAAQLGEMSQAIRAHLSRWTTRGPSLVEVSATQTAEGLVGKWRFNAPGAVLPPLLVAAVRGELGRQAVLLSPATVAFPGGPSVTKNNELLVRFPGVNWLPGRAIGQEPPLLTLDPKSAKSIAENAFANLMARRRAADRDRALIAMTAFEKQLPNGWRWFGDGRTSAEMGAWALLAQVVSPNARAPWIRALRTSVRLGTGWPVMRGDDEDQRRGVALGAMALGLSPYPGKRLAGVMMDLALCQRELAGGIRVMPLARQGMFGGRGSIFSHPYRVMGPQTVVARIVDGQLRLFANTPGVNEQVTLYTSERAGPIRGATLSIPSGLPGVRAWVWRRAAGTPPKMNVTFAPFGQPLPPMPKYEEAKPSA